MPFCSVVVLVDCCSGDAKSDESYRAGSVGLSFLMILAVGRRFVGLIDGTWPGSPGTSAIRESGRIGMRRLVCFGLSLKPAFIGTSLTPARAAPFSKQLHYAS